MFERYFSNDCHFVILQMHQFLPQKDNYALLNLRYRLLESFIFFP
jgi:hypothetical protein